MQSVARPPASCSIASPCRYADLAERSHCSKKKARVDFFLDAPVGLPNEN